MDLIEVRDQYSKLSAFLKYPLKGIESCSSFSEKLDKALAEGFPIDYCEMFCTDNDPPLLFLAVANHTEENNRFVKILLDHGADPNVIDGRGWNALIQCCWNIRGGTFRGNTMISDETFTELVKRTKDVNLKGEGNETALKGLVVEYIAAYQDNYFDADKILPKVRILMDAGADVNLGLIQYQFAIGPPIIKIPKDKVKEISDKFIGNILAYKEQKYQQAPHESVHVYYDYEL